ncbi:MAG: sensor histidine kinase [Hyphomicrobiaceae bacterium]|nr:sensor histidine kinase [Hyphomicrobiaceae bacterium]
MPSRLLILLGSIAALLPAILFGAYVLIDLVGRDQHAQRLRLEQTSRSLVAAFDRELQSLAEMATVLANSRLLRAGDVGAFEHLARDSASAIGYTIVLVDQTGQQLVNTRAKPGSELPRSRNEAFVEQVLQTNGPVVSNLVRTTTDGELAIVVGVPVEAGSRKLVVGVAPDLHLFERVLARVPLALGWSAAADDPTGSIVARSSQPDRFVGTKARLQTPDGGTASLNFTDLEGRASVMAYTVSAKTGYRAVVWAPEKDFYASTTTLQYSLGGFGGLVLLLTVAGAYFTGRLISDPIRYVADCADHLRDGRRVHHRRHTVMREANIASTAMEVASRVIAEREASLRQETEKTRLLMRELAHRTKNVMAVVSAIARQTSRSTSSLADFSQQFDSRLGGLARSMDLLVHNQWAGVELNTLLRNQLEPFGDPHRFRLEGPELLLTPQATQNVGLAIHELATNAVKHGALSVPEGKVVISWHIEGCDWIFEWKEAGGPAVSAPERRGFGRVVIEDLAKHGLGGQTRLGFEPDGIQWLMRAPLTEVMAKADKPAALQANGAPIGQKTD